MCEKIKNIRKKRKQNYVSISIRSSNELILVENIEYYCDSIRAIIRTNIVGLQLY